MHEHTAFAAVFGGAYLMENYIDWIDEDRSLRPHIILNNYKNILLFYDHDWEQWRHIFSFSQNDDNMKFILFDVGMDSFELKPASKFFENFLYEYAFQSFILISEQSILYWNFWDEIAIYATNTQVKNYFVSKIKEDYKENAKFFWDRYQSNWFNYAAELYQFSMD